MDFVERLNAISAKVNQLASTIQTEEATKTAFVMPFIHTVLGYDVFDPSEVVPEYVCDVGTKKGEKIDYAILKNGQIQILIETKKSASRSISTMRANSSDTFMSPLHEFPFLQMAGFIGFTPISMHQTKWMKSRS